MDDQPEGETEERKKFGSWWVGTLVGGIGGLIYAFLSSGEMGMSLLDALLLYPLFGLIAGSIGGLIARRWGTFTSLVLGFVFFILALIACFGIYVFIGGQ